MAVVSYRGGPPRVVARGRGDRMLKLDGPTGRRHRRDEDRGQVVDPDGDPAG
jgi:hypothetical protein